MRTFSMFVLLFLFISVVSLFQGCATAPKDFETPSGPIPGDQFGSMEIVGVISKSTTTLNQPNSNRIFEEEIIVDVPVGTEIIIPALRGWRLTYGEINPNTVESHIGTSTQAPSWTLDDHHFGIGLVNIFIKDVNAPDIRANPPKQTATIQIQLMLGDDNLDDRWSGMVNYNLICIKRSAVPVPTPR